MIKMHSVLMLFVTESPPFLGTDNQQQEKV